MSSVITEELLNILDAASDGATVMTASKPAVAFIMNMLPSTKLKRGDDYQESTLKLLEASRTIMPPSDFEEHFGEYESICDTREKLVVNGLVKSIKIRGEVRKYKTRAKTLHQSMTISSQQARRAALRILPRATSLDSNTVSNPGTSTLQEANNRGADNRDEDTQSMDITEQRNVYCSSASTLTLNDPFRETASVVVQDPDDISISGFNVWEDGDEQTSGRSTPTRK